MSSSLEHFDTVNCGIKSSQVKGINRVQRNPVQSIRGQYVVQSTLFESNGVQFNIFEYNVVQSNLIEYNVVQSTLFEYNVGQSNLFESNVVQFILF